VTPRFLRQKRRHAIVLITAVAAIITPGDAVTLTLALMLPLTLLYELSIFLSAGIHRRREQRLEEALKPSGETPAGSVPREEEAPMGAQGEDDA
jgi:sec-independent protein translocase protein TatC